QMKNFFMKPKIAFPTLLTAAILGALAGVLNIQGTPYSAGVGLSGHVGPLNYINLAADGWTVENDVSMPGTCLILPLVLNLGFLYIFSRKFNIIRSKDYKLDFE